ncbi:hypothetical protein MRB53_030803 [Persea americana]|uniref:Uncharacterized protein n=1 Tax=Persea americana TaxID=3435 RepID=A0ACC2KMT5_PERAE|nr:hypothetical protein MRB53_030803 [Persea americana]
MGGGTPTTTATATTLSVSPESISDRDAHYPIVHSPSLTSSDGSDSLRDDLFAKIADEFDEGTYLRRKRRTYEEIMQNYQNKSMLARIEILEDSKSKILSYKPGCWIEEVGGLKINDYNIPRTTTLLVIGLKGSGKSSLVNRISRVFESDKFSSDRAQVFYNHSGDGSYFLQEYMIPRGVQHGQMVIRDSDSAIARKNMKIKARHALHCGSEKRMVNFVIFVVDGVSVQKSMTNEDSSQYTRLITESFNCPYLSFKDDKPILLITHVDELSLSERARVRIQLGDLLGIPPATQIFDIPDKCDLSSELTIVEMLRYCLEHADRNLPFKQSAPLMGFQPRLPWMAVVVMVIVVVFVIHPLFDHVITGCHVRRQPPEVRIDWRSIRHMWLG